jgi:hypothetical protein
MTLGLSLEAFTRLHVVISLVGIASGLVVLCDMLGGRVRGGWTAAFLVTTILTSVTGFMFPFQGVGPPHVIGVISLVLLTLAVAGLYGKRLAGPWRWIYVVTAVTSLYLNVFVGVVQAFEKVPFLTPLAPTQSEPPFAVVQLAVLVLFVVLGIRAGGRLRPTPR